MADYKVAIDAGHGGNDPGAVYAGRQEKDDVLRLAMTVGRILENSGVEVIYVRDDDTYETPFKKAQDGNLSGADLFVSLHRNSSEVPDRYSGVETLVYAEGGVRSQLAKNINTQLQKVGFKNLGTDERPNLVVLKRTGMPAVLVEVGFINSRTDNAIFDNDFDEVAAAIAQGIIKTLYGDEGNVAVSGINAMRTGKEAGALDYGESGMDAGRVIGASAPVRKGYDGAENVGRTLAVNGTENVGGTLDVEGVGDADASGDDDETVGDEYDEDETKKCPCEKLYRVQVGAFKNKDNADRLLNSLTIEGFPVFMVYEDGLYKVQVGAFGVLSNAIKMEAKLRRYRYNTYITV